MIRQSEARLPPEKRREPQKPLTPDDFDLMKVVGRGAFGKVLLVRKKTGKHAGSVYAMKILKKSHIIKNDQVDAPSLQPSFLSPHPILFSKLLVSRLELYLSWALRALSSTSVDHRLSASLNRIYNCSDHLMTAM